MQYHRIPSDTIKIQSAIHGATSIYDGVFNSNFQLPDIFCCQPSKWKAFCRLLSWLGDVCCTHVLCVLYLCLNLYICIVFLFALYLYFHCICIVFVLYLYLHCTCNCICIVAEFKMVKCLKSVFLEVSTALSSSVLLSSTCICSVFVFALCLYLQCTGCFF